MQTKGFQPIVQILVGCGLRMDAAYVPRRQPIFVQSCGFWLSYASGILPTPTKIQGARQEEPTSLKRNRQIVLPVAKDKHKDFPLLIGRMIICIMAPRGERRLREAMSR